MCDAGTTLTINIVELGKVVRSSWRQSTQTSMSNGFLFGVGDGFSYILRRNGILTLFQCFLKALKRVANVLIYFYYFRTNKLNLPHQKLCLGNMWNKISL